MRTRHKQPNLVSMWMLDVFCCALGCVTLLWLLSTREAKIEASRNASAVELLAKSEAELKARQAELLATKAEFEQTKRKLNADLEDLQGKYLMLTTERDDTAKQLKNELVATLDDSDDVIWANIDAQVAEHRLRPGDIDVVATGQSRLEQRREIMSEFCFPEKRSAIRVTATKRVDSQRTRDRLPRWEFSSRHINVSLILFLSISGFLNLIPVYVSVKNFQISLSYCGQLRLRHRNIILKFVLSPSFIRLCIV